jgi:hypothetical protein
VLDVEEATPVIIYKDKDADEEAELALLQKRFIVSAVKLFFVSVSPADTILRIQKIDYFSYRLFGFQK